jgi:hypothetical protein
MTENKFSIVQFPPHERTKEVEVEIVPTSWIKVDPKTCYWPSKCSGATLKKLQKAAQLPSPQWNEHPFDKILGVVGKF